MARTKWSSQTVSLLHRALGAQEKLLGFVNPTYKGTQSEMRHRKTAVTGAYFDKYMTGCPKAAAVLQ